MSAIVSVNNSSYQRCYQRSLNYNAKNGVDD